MVDNLLELVFRQRYFAEDAEGFLRCESLEILLARSDDETCHIKGSRTDDKLVGTFSIITVGTMFST